MSSRSTRAKQARQLILPQFETLALSVDAPLVFDRGPDPGRRPEVIGNPLDLKTEPSLPKPSAYVQILDPEGRLRLEDRKLFNVILAESWSELASFDAPGPFAAPAAALKRAIGQETQRGNHRLRASLDRLLTTIVTFSRRMTDGRLAEAATTLISYRALAPRAGLVEWDFHPALRPYLASPGRWARLHLQTCARFHGRYGFILYEQMSLRENLDHPIWNVGLEELRAVMGVAGRYPYPSQLRQSVVVPALKEVNALAPFEVVVEPVEAAPRTAPRLRFRIVRTRKARG